ncbi:uncharacterized protein VTP21DRAFT_8237 [Calcarisporiella thermophila]|uniref:uncharacterized protein n=1 Tax=Calcarisporiella thermophila TaxID=911321 RepID=UPI003743D437
MSISRAPLNLRTHFHYDRTINWFPGHMARGLRQIGEQLHSVDLLVEARDARIPLSSVNHNFEKLVQGKDRLIVYNKADLADPTYEPIVKQAFAKYLGQKVLFTNADASVNVRKIIEHAANKARNDPLRFPYVTVMVVGLPNVGKSSLINAMRRLGVGRGKAAPTSPLPGYTRSVTGRVKVFEDPRVYLVDTPGVMMPYVEDPMVGLKMAVTGGIGERATDESLLADYLLWRLNQFENYSYIDKLNLPIDPTDNLEEFLPALAKRIGAIRRGGELDLSAAARFFLQQYRAGKLGRHTLDDIHPAWFSSAKVGVSRRQAKKQAKLEERAKKRKETPLTVHKL